MYIKALEIPYCDGELVFSFPPTIEPSEEFIIKLSQYIQEYFGFKDLEVDNTYYLRFFDSYCDVVGVFGFSREYMEFYFYPTTASLLGTETKIQIIQFLNEMDLDWCF